MKNKLFFVLFFLILPSVVTAGETFRLTYETKELKKTYDKTIEKTLSSASEINEINNVVIDVSNFSSSQKNPHTIFKNNGCYINISLKDSPQIFSDKHKEIEFLILHELGHCVLGDGIFKVGQISWGKQFKNTNNIPRNIYTNDLSSNSMKCSKCDYLRNYNILVSYSELFSDIFAMNYYLKKEERIDDILVVYEYRKKMYEHYGIKNSYISHYYVENMIKNNDFKPKTKHEIEIIAQEIILNHVKMNQKSLTLE